MANLHLIISDLSYRQPIGATVCVSLGYGYYSLLAAKFVVVLFFVPATLTAYQYFAKFLPYWMAMYQVVIILIVTSRSLPGEIAFRDGPQAVRPTRALTGHENEPGLPPPVIQIDFSTARTQETPSLSI
ncbi:hypothetical protein C8J56DRAFT_1054099 [Mycena floridula]|nr:hypothetical protein C8J56DRAFT_1054099 [Mycena floridula]